MFSLAKNPPQRQLTGKLKIKANGETPGVARDLLKNKSNKAKCKCQLVRNI